MSAYEKSNLSSPSSLLSVGQNSWRKVFGVDSPAEAIEVVGEVRGHVQDKEGRALGAILNSNPIVVDPPSLDLPVESYRAFREKYGQRSTMLFVSTLDGLLHGIHTGVHDGADDEVSVRKFDTLNPFTGGGEDAGEVYQGPNQSQREAWAYVPEMLRRDYVTNLGLQPNLLDGTPVIKDVRLCNSEGTLNFSQHACKSAESGGVVAPEDQWRTVLVQGLGQAGSGFFALDVTNTGGRVGATDGVIPDPIPLWEFNWRWERRQIMALKDAGNEERYSYSNSVANPVSDDFDDAPAMNATSTRSPMTLSPRTSKSSPTLA